MENDVMKKVGSVRKVVHVTITADGKRTEHELTPDELEKWKAENGYTTENKTESDTNRETDSDTRESE